MTKQEEEYKTALLIDLIFYVMDMLLKNQSNKIDMVTYIVDAWAEKKKENAARYNAGFVKQHCEKTGESADVATILLEAHQQDFHEIRSEVAHQVKQVVAKTFINKR